MAESAVEETRSKAERTESAEGKCASWSARTLAWRRNSRKARLIIDVQGKVAGLLGLSLEDGDELVKAAEALATYVGVKPACDALRVARATFYRRRRLSTGHQQPRPTPARALSEKERDKVFDTLCSERFVDRSPAEVMATLLDEDVYLCSERTMYRVLASQVPSSRAPSAAESFRIPEIRVDGDGPGPGLVLGYHTAAGAEEVELLLPLRPSWTSSAATSWDGWWRIGRARPWPGA